MKDAQKKDIPDLGAAAPVPHVAAPGIAPEASATHFALVENQIRGGHLSIMQAGVIPLSSTDKIRWYRTRDVLVDPVKTPAAPVVPAPAP
jgi:hypothetical protein